MKWFTKYCFVLLATFVSGQRRNASFEAYIEGLWRMADPNLNGVFDHSEFETLYTTYDTNGDRNITETEFMRVWRRNSPLLNVTMAEQMWTGFDVNHDNVWTNADFVATYARIDTNQNGLAEKPEFMAYYMPFFRMMFEMTFGE